MIDYLLFIPRRAAVGDSPVRWDTSTGSAHMAGLELAGKVRVEGYRREASGISFNARFVMVYVMAFRGSVSLGKEVLFQYFLVRVISTLISIDLCRFKCMTM